ncbi:MAG: YbaB/EbfC family nucleoid-associated protein [Paenibacillaceae bacterium]|nr:YbaB/EbfC family nucleoid-associated protein [Paenibacillaceae bacterium]
MEQVLRQAQQMKDTMTKKREEIHLQKFEGASADGAVSVVFTGERRMCSLRIDESLRDNPQQLEAHVCAAVNAALGRIQERMEKEIQDVAGGMIPSGLF